MREQGASRVWDIAAPHGLESDYAASARRGVLNPLQWAVIALEIAQAKRRRTEEHLRAAFLSEDSARTPGGPLETVRRALLDLRQGALRAPESPLASHYQREWVDERRMRRLVESQVVRHPAWSWLRCLGGVDMILVARLLARLDITRAPYPSSFWAFCGLATVEALEHVCERCGLTIRLPRDAQRPASHRVPGDRKSCTGQLTLTPPDAAPVRIAQRADARGVRSPFRREAKEICYRIGLTLSRGGGDYRRYYEDQLDQLAHDRSAWTPARRHLTALRKTEKRFLVDLWLAWGRAVGLGTGRAYGSQSECDQPGG